MSPDQLTGLITGLTALLGAIGGLIALFRHVNGPAHSTPAQPPPGPTPPAS